jgi:hypothetical protein
MTDPVPTTPAPGAPLRPAPEQALSTLAAGLGQAGWRPQPHDPGDAWQFVARTSQFRWRWMATQLHTFVFGLPVPQGADTAWLDEQLVAAVQFARRAGGGLPGGLQTGRAVVLAAVGADLDPALRTWAAKPHARKWAVVTYPVLGDVVAGTMVQPKRPALGAVYHGYLADVAETYLAPALAR